MRNLDFLRGCNFHLRFAESPFRNAEVRGSIPLCSTKRINDLRQGGYPAFFICHRFVTWSFFLEPDSRLLYASPHQSRAYSAEPAIRGRSQPQQVTHLGGKPLHLDSRRLEHGVNNLQRSGAIGSEALTHPTRCEALSQEGRH